MSRETILVVDDTPANLQLLEEILTTHGYDVRPAPSAVLALRSIKHSKPDLILLDINMPHISGYSFAEQLKETSEYSNIPIIFISALSEVEDKVKAFKVGGVDYINKPFQVAEVIARVSTHLKIAHLQTNLQDINKTLEQRVTEKTQALTNEVFKKSKALEKVEFLANHDMLTSLPNKLVFNKILKEYFYRAPADEFTFSIILLEFVGMQEISESLGRHISDELLKLIATRLQIFLNPNTSLFKLDTFEFVFLIKEVKNNESFNLADAIRQSIKHVFIVEGHNLYIDVNIGISKSDSCEYQEDLDILRDADLALRKSKTSETTFKTVFNMSLRLENNERVTLTEDLRDAVKKIGEESEFKVYYQGIFCAQSHQLRGFEALIRWFHSTKGLISPAKFIPVAEESGHIVAIGDWINKSVINQLSEWQEQFLFDDDFFVNINVAPLQLNKKTFGEDILSLMQTYGVSQNLLKLELTESTIQNDNFMEKHLFKLSEMGLQFCLDDFGTGYSSLGRLHDLPFNTLKIDRCFIKDIQTEGRSIETVKSIMQLGHNLGLTIVAEGIETSEQLEILKSLNCDLIQGFHFAKPVPSSEALELIASYYERRYKRSA